MNMKDAMITCHIRGAMVAILAFSAMTLPAAAQTSVYGSMAVAGDINKWNTTPNMMLVGENLWQGEFYITAFSNRFKFVTSNNWDFAFIDTNQPSNFQLPITGKVDRIANTNIGDITITNTQPGFYRFTFNDLTWDYRVDRLYTIASGVNILQNPSFEDQGSDSEKAKYWAGDVDGHGNFWNWGSSGTPRRRDWRGHSGSWSAAIEGQYSSSRETFGGWWREGAATPGLTYQGSAWFWADARVGNVWSADMMEIKIEFYDAGGTQILYKANQFQGINEKWTKKTVSGVAPPGTAWARLVIDSYGNGTQGSLQFDDAELRPIVSRNQDFNLWGSFTSDGTTTQDDWMVSIGKATTVGARSGYCISLPGPGAVSNFVRSPQFVDGVGQITFWYRHSETNTEVAEPVSFIVQKSPDGTNWTNIGSVTNILFQEYRAYSISVYEPSPYYMRIVHSSGTNRLLIDDVTVAAPVDSPRYMDFNLWPDAGTNMGYSTYLNWEVITGRVSTINAKDGKSLLLPANAATTNFLRTPLLAEGYGDISFYYARGTNGNRWAAFAIQSSPDGTNWSTIATVSNIASTGYAQYKSYFYGTNPSCLRICNLTNPATPDMITLMVDEGFNDAPTPPVGWTFNGIKIYDSDLNSGRAKPSLMFDTSNDYVRTPALSNPTNLSFWLKGVTTSTSNNEFLVEGASGGAWATITNISPLPTSGTTYSVPIAQSVTNIQFTYKKLYRNAAFDDVIIHGLPQSDQPPQDLLLDEISIDYPVLMRTQNFNAWPTEDSYGTYMFHGWIVNDGMIGDTNAYEGQSARMNESPAQGQYIQSSRMPDGIGTISFVYARQDAGSPYNVYYQIQLSPDGATWTTNDTIHVESTNYTAYQKYMYDTTNHYLKLLHISGGDIVTFDNISISALGPRADVIMNNSYTPPTPYTNDPVYLQCNVIPLYGATILSVTSYYRIGTSGSFTALSMTITDRVNYVSAAAIPAQKAGTTVQYYVRCNFSGPGSEANSPKYSPAGGSNSPASYRIPRNPSGHVWINELNYVNDAWDTTTDTNEFVEITGPQGWDLSGWMIEFYINTSTITGEYYTAYATYVLPEGMVLPNTVSGYGFYVLGDADVPNLNKVFAHTNTFDGTQISDGVAPSGVRLYNEGGGVESSVCYGGPLSGFNRTQVDDDGWDSLDPIDIQLSGMGSNYTSFVWTTNSMTPGLLNVGQSFGTNEFGPDPDIPIGGFSRVSSQLSITMTATNGWAPEVWYTTALLPNPQSWIWVSTRTVTTNAGLWTIQFAYPAGQNNCCFRVEMSK